MQDQLIEYLRRLVQINSVNPDLSTDGQGERDIAEYIQRHFQLLQEDKNDRLCVNLAKKHFSFYLKGFDKASIWRKAFMKTTIPAEINMLLEQMQKEYPG